jgi:glyoxylase-like metal-dependent hydrolase (beta-lactamase superfamily II)
MACTHSLGATESKMDKIGIQAEVALRRACALALVTGTMGLLALVGSAAGAADAPPATPDLSNVEIVPWHVQGNVWLLAGETSNVAVQVGDEGVLVVDTGLRPLAEKLLVQVKKLAGDKPIRFVIDTHMHPDHTGGNEVIRKAGFTILAGNVANDDIRGQQGATVLGNENIQLHMAEQGANGQPAVPQALWPTETHTEDLYNMYFNDEAVQLYHPHDAHTDGDTFVLFRRSDVIVTGDLFVTTSFPIIDVAHGGTINGEIAALNQLIDLTVPADKQENGTLLIPGHGRLCDQADLVEFRDMTTIIRDRVQDLIDKGKTLEQVKAAKPAADYDGRFGGPPGLWTADRFVEAIYKTLKPTAKTRTKAKASG